MTPEKQYAESVKYVSLQYGIVPQPSGLYSLYIAYGQHRTYNGEYTAAELIARFESDFAHQLKLSESQRKQAERAATLTQEINVLDIPFKIELNGLDLGDL